MEMSRRSYYIYLLLIFLAANAARWGMRERMQSGYFHAESASHLRYTRLVAEGKGIPDLDRKAQWPEGLRVKEDTSVFMEYFYGCLFRLFGSKKMSLEAFLRFAIPFFFSLSVFPVASISSGLWRSRGAGLISALLFAVTCPLVARSNGFEYIREGFTVPALTFHLYFFVSVFFMRDDYSDLEESERRSTMKKSLVMAALSGVFLFIALASWQGTQFYLVPFTFILLVRSIFFPIDREDRLVDLVVILWIIAAAVAVPYLRKAMFFFSIPMAFTVSWLAVDCTALSFDHGGLNRRIPGKRHGYRRLYLAVTAVAVLAVVVVFTILSKRHLTEYSHFLSMIFYKFRYMEKPSDPRLLPFDVRTFWVGPFNAPDALYFFIFALPLTLAVPVPLSVLFKMVDRRRFEYLFFVYFLALSFVLFVLFKRLIWMYGFFGVIVAGGNVYEFTGHGSRRMRFTPAGGLLLFTLVVSLFQDFAWEGRADFWKRIARVIRVPYRESYVVYPYSGDVEGELFAWIRKYIPEDAPIMSLHYLSPQVLTYTSRPTNLNDFFESVALRRKAQRFLVNLYSKEDALYDFCRRYGSEYVLVSTAVGCDPTKDSPIYQAGHLSLPQNSAAFKMIFAPERLRYFRLVYENELYRIFRVGASSIPTTWPRSPLFYEMELLWKSDGDIRRFYNSVMRIYAMTARGRRLLRAGKPAAAEEALTSALRSYYFYPAWKMLDGMYAKGERLKDKDSLAHFAYRHDPNRADVCVAEIEALLREGKRDEAREVLRKALKLPATRSVGSRLKELEGELQTEARG